MNLFVVGTGRCGSTLLGNMLGQHPDLLELSEFFAALDRRDAFSAESVTGEQFAEFIDRVDVANEVIHQRQIIPREVLRPGREKGVPPLMIATMPTQFSSPEVAYKEMLNAVSRFPFQPYRDHYHDLFAWLMERTGKSYWMERSGPSIEYLSELTDFFPDAKFVYLSRDGGETALSMMNHVVFQFYVSDHFEPFTPDELRATEFGGSPVTPDDPISRRLHPDYLSPGKYGEFWSHQQVLGFKGLARLDPKQVLFVRFEDVLADPREWMARIAAFFGLPQRDGWIARATSLLHGTPPRRFDKLPRETQDEIRRGCAIGNMLLGPQGSPWDTCKSRTVWESLARV
jgi:putative sulfotransferase